MQKGLGGIYENTWARNKPLLPLEELVQWYSHILYNLYNVIFLLKYLKSRDAVWKAHSGMCHFSFSSSCHAWIC